MDVSRVETTIRRYLSIRSSHTGKIGSDGCLYYISDVTSTPTVWRSCRDGGVWKTDIWIPWERRVGSFELSRDYGLAFSTDMGGDERWAIYVLHGDGRLERVAGDDGTMNILGPWSPDGRMLAYTSNARNSVDFDLYIYDSISGSTRRVWTGEGITVASEWIDDYRLLVVRRNTNLDSDIILVDVFSGASKNLTSHGREALNTNPKSIGGDRMLFLTNMGEEFLGIAVMDVATGSWKYLYREQWDVEALDVGGSLALFSVNENGESRVKVGLLSNGGSRLEVSGYIEGLPRGTVTSISYEGRLDVAAISLSSPRVGVEVYVVRGLSPGAPAERATRSPKAWLSEEEFVEPEVFTYTSFDGLEVSGLFYKPRLGRPPYPAVVYLHGGPESQERVRFNLFPQVLAGLGIATVAPNFRGSSGYGKTFIHLDDVEKREGAVHDVYYAVKHLSDRGFVDMSRLCVMGGSYGGYLTLMSLAFYPGLWRCGVEIVGIVNLVTFIRNTSAYRRRYRMAEYGDPERHGAVMLALSPISHVDRISAPLMVIHGARDPRVPVSEAEQIVEALRERGVPVRYVRLEDEGHGIVNVGNRPRVYAESVKFIYESLVGGGRG